MSFYISKLPPYFFNNKKINRIQNDFLDRLKKEDEERFFSWMNNTCRLSGKAGRLPEYKGVTN